MKRWPDDAAQRLIEIAQRHPRNEFHRVYEEATRLFGVDVTGPMVRGVMKRAGKGALSDYCTTRATIPQAAPTVPSAPRELPDLGWDDDEATTPLATRDTEPAPAEVPCRVHVDREEERPAVTVSSERTRRVLIIPDTHAPVHDERALSLVLAVGAAWKPDVIIHLGDLIDAESVSSYTRKPSALTLSDEVAAANRILDRIDALGASERYFCIANHEARIERTILEKAPGLYGMCGVPELLRLRERGWQWCAYKDHVMVGKIAYTHDQGNAGAQAHLRAKDAIGRSTVIGHTHRMHLGFDSTLHDGPRVAAMFGCLLDFAKVSYMYRAQVRHWQLGFGTGILLPDGFTFLRPHPIVDYRCEVDGVVYAG